MGQRKVKPRSPKSIHSGPSPSILGQHATHPLRHFLLLKLLKLR
jgi:hypothetical protein